MLYLNETKHHFFLLSAIITCLLIDLGQFFLAGILIIPSLLCFYCMIVMHYERYASLGFISLLQCLETFCFYNSFYLAGIQLIPITILAFSFKKNLYPSRLYPIMLSCIGILIQMYAIEGYFLHMWPTSHYTIMRIGGTLFIIICFSLTINIWGVQDNRA